MCGRYVSTTPANILAERFQVAEIKAGDLPPDYNVAPTEQVFAVAESGKDHVRRLGSFTWGLVPSWAKDPAIGNKMINTRAESALEKPAFRRILQRHRCIIPADGFYEWQRRERGPKQPFYIHPADGQPLAFAGLWEVWHDPSQPDDAPPLRTCSIITTDANATVGRIHDRMPVVLLPEAWEEWLDPDNKDVDALGRLLVPAPEDYLVMYPITTRVNSVRNDGPELLEPLEGHQPA